MQKNESKKAFCVSPKQAFWYLLSGKKKKKKKKSPQRHGVSYKSLFRNPHTITRPGDIHSLLLVVKEKKMQVLENACS